MTPTVYVGNHPHARVVCHAFAEGCGGKVVPADGKLHEGPAAMWGILRGAGDRIKDCELHDHPYWYIDHGYFRSGHYDGYYRVVHCGLHPTGMPARSNGRRWETLNLDIKPWKGVGGDHVVYLPISRYVAEFLGIDAEAFDAEQIAKLTARTKLPVRTKTKDDGDLASALPGATLVAGFQSNALLEAARLGVPIRELGSSPASVLSNHSMRNGLFRWLADNQWTLEEIRSGKCWADLQARYGKEERAA